MDRAVKSWLSSNPELQIDGTILAKKLNKAYTIYGTMLLLPPPAMDATGLAINDPALPHLYKCICKELKVTHIALNKPIPLHNAREREEEEEEDSEPVVKHFNILRSPSDLTPLHGDFGPSSISTAAPTQEDYDRAFWVTAKQNGIYQCWAPRWTMFSRGNISEKARLLTLPSVLQAVAEGESCAVDLYAGIGYFAFSYAKAGVSKVLCWDLNAWSCEGLRRGAKKNKWKVVSWDSGLTDEMEALVEARLIVFNESNEHAPRRMKMMERRLPPVRHVNCGMLPSSRDSLKLAAEVLDKACIGWAHVHENFLVEQIEQKAEETRQEFESLLSRSRGDHVATKIEHINRLKSYAPGVMHCVIDIVVYPTAIPP